MTGEYSNWSVTVYADTENAVAEMGCLRSIAMYAVQERVRGVCSIGFFSLPRRPDDPLPDPNQPPAIPQVSFLHYTPDEVKDFLGRSGLDLLPIVFKPVKLVWKK